MRRIVPLAIASAVALAAGSFQAQAGFTVTTTAISIDSNLEAAGWEGLVVTLTATGGSVHVNGVDFKNDEFPGTSGGGTIGIFGNIHQNWSITRTSSTNRTPSPDGALFNNDGGDTDSAFINASYWSLSVPDAFTEDNNRVNGTNPPYSRSPLTDTAPSGKGATTIPGFDYGVGSLMTFSGAAIGTDAQVSVDVAFVIIPTDGALFPVKLRGYAAGIDLQTAFLDVQLNPVPEPASLGVLALGGLALLAKRRKR